MSSIADITCCPVTGSALRETADGTLTSAEGREYRRVDGVPVLLANDGLFAVEPAQSSAGARRSMRATLKRLVNVVVPSPTRTLGTAERYDRFGSLVESSTANPRVLIVGGGELGQGMGGLLAHQRIKLVETDVYVGPRTAIVCDAHQLPFLDESFDGAVAQAVLEHVLDPPQVVAEIHRVLKPDGLIYAETPFMAQVHEGAYDVTRYSMVGHRRLFRCFDELEAGLVCGPATALVWSIRYLARSFPRRSRVLREILDRLVCIAFFWIKYLDDVLVDRPGAVDAASATYFLGRKRPTPISDQAVIESYRGGFRPAPRRPRPPSSSASPSA